MADKWCHARRVKEKALWCFVLCSPGGTRGIQSDDRADKQRFEEDPSHEREMAVLWLRLLLLYTWVLTMAGHLSQQAGKSVFKVVKYLPHPCKTSKSTDHRIGFQIVHLQSWSISGVRISLQWYCMCGRFGTQIKRSILESGRSVEVDG